MKPRRAYLCHAIAAPIGLLITVFFVQLLDRHPVVLLDPTKSYITPTQASSGQAVTITWSAIEKRNCDGVVVPRVIDNAGRVFEYAHIPTVYHDLLIPGARSFSKSLVLPLGMAPGKARYEAVVIRWCNWAQRLIWPMVDSPFPIYFEAAAIPARESPPAP